MKILKLILAIYFIGNLSNLTAQNTIQGVEFVDVIYLKNGNVFRGTILEYQPGEKVSIKILGAEPLVFEDSDILKIRQESLDAVRLQETEAIKLAEVDKKTKKYEFKEKGWYNVTYFALANGRIRQVTQFGVGFHNISGFMWNRKFGLGLGLGVDNYAVGLGEIVYPVFVEARGYFSPKRVSLYYSLAAGYGLSFKNKANFVTEANGGYMFHPALGLRLGASSEANITIDLGYKRQKAGFTRELPFTGEIDIRNIVYNRLTLRAGLLF